MKKRMSIAPLWLHGLVSYRAGRLLLAALGVAFTVALFTTLGIFVSTSAEP